jgi:proteasome accessory factor C
VSTRLTAAARLQRLLALLQWAARSPDGVEVDELCVRFRLQTAELLRELDLASMIGADATHYDEMPFEVFVEDGRVYVRMFSLRRPMRLTPAECLALVVAADALIDRVGDPDGGGALGRALEKLGPLVGARPGESVEVAIDPDGGETGRTIRRALDEDRRVSFTYWTYGRDEVASRSADPWRLFPEAGQWYLVGHAHDAGAARTFRLDRMSDVVIDDAPRRVAMPKGLAGSVQPADESPEVVIDLGPGARWVAEAHPVRNASALDDGWLRVTLGIGGRRWLERLLVSLGPHARLQSIDPDLGPPDLAAQAARRVLARYRGGS